MIRRCSRLLLVVAVALPLLAASTARAEEDFLPPRSLGVGGALRADATGALSVFLNPASMALAKGYSVEAMIGFRVQDLGLHLNAAIVDSVTSRVAAGIYYSYMRSEPKFTVAPGTTDAKTLREGNETGIALAIALGERFSFGLIAKYVRISTNASNPSYVSDTLTPGVAPQLTLDSTTQSATADGFSMDGGLQLKILEGLAIAVTGYNLIPLYSVENPISMGMGIAYKPIPTLTLAFDGLIDFNKYHNPETGKLILSGRAGGGLEWLIAGKVALRVGGSGETTRNRGYLHVGLAYVGQSFAIDLSYRQSVAGGIDSMLVLGARIFVE